jgi:hypothetical protein
MAKINLNPLDYFQKALKDQSESSVGLLRIPPSTVSSLLNHHEP